MIDACLPAALIGGIAACVCFGAVVGQWWQDRRRRRLPRAVVVNLTPLLRRRR